MDKIDLQPFLQFTVGFDEIVDILDHITENGNKKQNHYPPYNIEKLGGEYYCITVAVAGFEEKNLEITKDNNILNIKGYIAKKSLPSEHIYLYKGIAERSFQLNFRLVDHMDIQRVFLENGILRILMLREVPESLKPQKITIETNGSTNNYQHILENKVLDPSD